MRAAGSCKGKLQNRTGKMQCEKGSYLLLHDGDSHPQVHHPAVVLLRASETKGSFCPDKFLQDSC